MAGWPGHCTAASTSWRCGIRRSGALQTRHGSPVARARLAVPPLAAVRAEGYTLPPEPSLAACLTPGAWQPPSAAAPSPATAPRSTGRLQGNGGRGGGGDARGSGGISEGGAGLYGSAPERPPWERAAPSPAPVLPTGQYPTNPGHASPARAAPAPAALTGQLELGGRDQLLQLLAALGAEGRHAAQHLVEQHPHAPPVNRLAVPAPRNHLGGLGEKGKEGRARVGGWSGWGGVGRVSPASQQLGRAPGRPAGSQGGPTKHRQQSLASPTPKQEGKEGEKQPAGPTMYSIVPMKELVRSCSESLTLPLAASGGGAQRRKRAA